MPGSVQREILKNKNYSYYNGESHDLVGELCVFHLLDKDVILFTECLLGAGRCPEMLGISVIKSSWS